MTLWMAIISLGAVLVAFLIVRLKALSGPRRPKLVCIRAETARESLEKLGIHSGD